ncbi:hypothetical protein INR49_011108 [Caranx melampygus]|nr:hypothetical protein INR49_011108 [Caranx melampygus]
MTPKPDRQKRTPEGIRCLCRCLSFGCLFLPLRFGLFLVLFLDFLYKKPKAANNSSTSEKYKQELTSCCNQTHLASIGFHGGNHFDQYEEGQLELEQASLDKPIESV